MTRYEDPTEIVLERSLNNQATNAPGDDFLLDRVQHRIKARRNAKTAAAGVIAAGATVAVILGVTATLNNQTPPPIATNSPTTNASTALTADKGWRWESYGQVEVQVPASWGYGAGIDYPPCLIDSPQKPLVGRPVYAIPTIACDADPVELAFRADSLTFHPGGAYARQPGSKPVDNGWVEETRVVAGRSFTVFSKDAALRKRILDSARPIQGADQQGCAPDNALVANPALRPAPGGGLAAVGTVESISICRYWLAGEDTTIDHPLLSSARYDGERAAALVAAILASPTGTGPNTPTTCSDKYGSEIVTLTVRGSKASQEVVLRYSGCDHNGFDDGTTRWKLTKENFRPAVAEPNKPHSGSGTLDLLYP